jgi:hypothetical protein
MIEEWRSIEGFEGRYEVSNLGSVRGIGRRGANRPLKLFIGRGGYAQVGLHVLGRKVPKSKHVHTLVAAAFLGVKPDGLIVCHNNGNRLNNCVENIRYDTPKENSADMIRHGRSLPGERNHQAVMTEQRVRELRALRASDRLSFRELGKIFGISKSGARVIAIREAWAHVS